MLCVLEENDFVYYCFNSNNMCIKLNMNVNKGDFVNYKNDHEKITTK